MSWFKAIYESIVNEISADDAYNRFYNKIPREDYDRILDGDPAPDKFMQFMLNSVRDGKSDVEDAVAAVKAYKSADQLVKQSVLNKFRAGEYEDATDVLGDVEYFTNGGGIVSRKKFAKEGYIKLKENERWIATCTTNYMANNHYFGKSRWCTASDRMGRYDGYHMFLNYTLDAHEGVLIQFKWKGKVRPENENEPEPLDDPDREKFSKEGLGYIGDEIDEQHSEFQVQVEYKYTSSDYENKRASIGQVCDFFDNGMYNINLKEYIGDDMYSILEDNDLQRYLFKIEEEQSEKEKVYQEKMDEILEKKRQRREAELQRLREQLETQCKEENERQAEIVKQYWQKFVDGKGYENKELVAAMIKRDNEEYWDDYGIEEYQKTGFVGISDNLNMATDAEKSMRMISFYAMMGVEKYVGTVDDEHGFESYEILSGESKARVTGTIVAIMTEDYDVVKAFDFSSENVKIDITPVTDRSKRWGSYSSRYYGINAFDESKEDDDLDKEKCIVYDAKLNKIFGFRSMRFPSFYQLSNNEAIFLDADSTHKYIIYNEETGETKPWKKGDPHVSALRGTNGFCFYTNEGNTQKMYAPLEGIYGLEVPTMQKIYSVRKLGYEDNTILIEFSAQYMDSPNIHNFYRPGDKDLLFGVNGRYADWDNQSYKITTYRGWGNDEYETILYSKKDGKYHKMEKGGLDKICDRYGKTQEDLVAKKNFDDWQKAGGHSPEAQAQMDKMWTDRNGEGNGKDAFRDWNDDDLRRDDREGLYTYHPDFKFNTALQSFDKDDRWGGQIGLKDPEGYTKSLNQALGDDGNGGLYKMLNGEIPDYVRRNPWYRVDRQGRDIDQPWYDEDEIPANLSDRVVREQKINEQYNKMKSIWDRMGLND